MSDFQQGSIGATMLWMVFISVILFLLPVFGPFMGGKKTVDPGAAIMAVSYANNFSAMQVWN